MILPPGHYSARQYGAGRSNSGAAGYKTRPARIQSKARGIQHQFARGKPIWILYAHPGNFKGYEHVCMPRIV